MIAELPFVYPMSKFKNTLLRYYPKIFAKPKFFEFNNFLIDLGLRGVGIMNYENNRISGEKYFSEYVIKNYKPENVFDVGAHKGDYTELYRTTNSCIFSFEPNPRPFKILRERFKNYKNISAINIGLSDTIHDEIIYDIKDKFGSVYASLHREVITGLHKCNAQEIIVKSDTLDNFAYKNSIKNIDLLKVDTEGSELSILKGAINLIEQKAIKIIHFEFNEMNVYSRTYLKDFFDILKNYNLYRLLPNSFLPIHYKYPHKSEFFAFQNIVAFREDIDKICI